jgi:hypothetical protein
VRRFRGSGLLSTLSFRAAPYLPLRAVSGGTGWLELVGEETGWEAGGKSLSVKVERGSRDGAPPKRGEYMRIAGDRLVLDMPGIWGLTDLEPPALKGGLRPV